MIVNLVRKNYLMTALTCVLALALSACGGGSSGDAPATAAATGSSSSASVAGNHAPTISGTAATTATVGNAYTFSPTGSDADGDTLTYSYTGTLPAGLTMNTATGQVAGSPTVAGTYASIVISVSDGKGGSASLSSFTITVAAGAATGSAVLSWTAPALNTDGTTLTDLVGYKVYYGTSPSTLTNSVSVTSGTTTTINNLTTGVIYYFAIASISSSGGEGNKSNVASKSI